MAVAGAVWLPVLPDMSRFSKQVRAGATANLATTGKAAGSSYAKGMTKAVSAGNIASTMSRETASGAAAGAKAVQDATGKVVKARNTAANAAGAVRVAEAKLSDLRATGKASSGQLATAEERLAKAQRTSATASQAAQAAQANLVKIGSATQNSFASTSRAATSAATSTGRFGSIGSAAMSKVRAGAWQVASAVPVVGNFTAGLRSSSAAASALTGRAGTMGGAVRSAMSTVAGGVSNATAGFARMGQSVTGIGARVRQSIGQGMIAPIGALTRSIAPLAGAAGFLGLAKSAFTAANTIDNTSRTLTGLYGSAQDAGDMMGRLRKLSTNSPIDYQAYAQASQQLAYMGIKGRDAEGVLRNVGAAIVASGKGSEAMGQASQAMLQMVNSGKVYAAQLNQISATGVPVFSSLAKHFNTNIANVREMVTEGKVSIDDVMASIRNAEGPTFQSMVAASKRASGSMSNQWKMIKDNAVVALGQVTLPLVRSLAAGMSKLPAVMSTLKPVFGPVFSGLGNVLRTVWSAIQPLAMVLGGAFLIALRAVGAILNAVVVPVLQFFASLIRPLMPVIIGIAVAFGTWYAIGMAVAMVTGAVTMFRNAIMFARLAWTALQLAFVTSPIGFVIALIAGLAAAVIYCWNNFAWFRTAVTAVWNAIVAAAQWAWTTILQPVFNAIGMAATWLWQNILVPFGQGVAAVFRVIGSVLSWLWNNIIHPIVMVWMAIFRALYTILVVVVLTPIILTIRAVGAAFAWLWANAIRPAVNAIGTAARWLWNNAIGPAFRAIGAGARVVGSVFGWLWRNAIKPAWDGICAAANWAWNNILHPIFTIFGNVIDTVGRGFKNFGKIVTGIWNTIKNAVKKGVQIVIDIVWNNSLRKVAQLANKIPMVGSLIPDKWVNQPIKLAKGGVVPGYSPGNDTVPAVLSPGEAVLVPGAARAIGPAGVAALNAAFGGGGGTATAAVPGFAGGGLVTGGKPSGMAGGTASSADTAATPAAGPVTDPALLAAATAATTALNAASVILNATLLQLTTTVVAYQTQLVTLGTRTATYQTQVTALRTLGLLPLVAQIRAGTIPALIALGARYVLLGTQTMQLQVTSTAQWNLLRARIFAVLTQLTARQNQFAAFEQASWNRIASTVNGSVNRQNAAFGALNRGMAGVRNAMSQTANWAVSQYGRMKAAAADPVRWVLNNPFNRGIIAAWNKLDAQFKFNKHVGNVAVPFAVGGKVNGPGTATSDSVPARLSRGEFVVREQIAKRAYPFLHALNAGNAEAVQATGGPRAHLARGGVVAPTGGAQHDAIARGLAVAKSYNGKPYIWGGVGPGGVDCSGMVSVVTNALRGEANIHRRLGVARSQPWPGFTRGLTSAWATGFNSGHTAATLSGTNVESSKTPIVFPGKHGADDKQFSGHASLPFVGGRFVSGGAGGVDFTAMVNDAFKSTYSMIGQVGKRWPGNHMATQAGGVAKQAADKVKNKAVEEMSVSMDIPGSGAQRWAPVVLRALAMLGQPASLLQVVLRRLNQESGGNPRAINGWDVNARRGTPSKGLMQVIDPTFNSNWDPRTPHDIWNPLSNIVASMRYAMGRYGSLSAAYNRAGGYDNGGFLPPGVSTVVNKTGRPEPVLTDRQWHAIQGNARGGEGNGPQVVMNASYTVPRSPEETAAATSRAIARSIRTGA